MGVLSSSITLLISDCVDSHRSSLLRPKSFVLPPDTLFILTVGLDLLWDDDAACAVGALDGASAALTIPSPP